MEKVNTKKKVSESLIIGLLTLTPAVAELTKILVKGETNDNSLATRWTFFRVTLVFEFEFEIFWSLGPWDIGTPGTLEPLDLGTLRPLPSSNSSSYFPLHPHTSSYLCLICSSFGMVWLWGGRVVVSCDF